MKYNVKIQVAGQIIQLVGVDASDEEEAQHLALVQARSMVRVVRVEEA